MMGGDVVDVLVVGAGPTGLALGAVVASCGAEVAVIDAIAGPERESSRATTVHAATLEQLDRLGGAGAEIAQHAVRAQASSLWSGQRRIAQLRWDRLPSRYACMANLPQTHTETLLRRRLEAAGVEVQWGLSMTAVETEGDQARVEVEQAGRRQELRARYVVGCDGAHSAARQSLGVPLEGTTHEERFLLGDVHLRTDLDPEQTHVFVSTRGVLGIMPMPGGSFRLNGTLARGEQLTAERLPELMNGRLLSRPDVELGEVGWLAEYRTHSRLAARYRVGPVFLAGDAAHLNSPVGGQGMNVGIQDAVNLGWKLAHVIQGRAHESLLDTYEAERRPVAAAVLRASETNTRMLTARNPIERTVRNTAMRLAHRLPPVQAKLTHEPAGFNQRYRSDAVWKQARRRPAPTGRRLPSPVLGNSPPRWLHDEFTNLDYDLIILRPSQAPKALTNAARQHRLRVRRITQATGADPGDIADPTGATGHALDGRSACAVLVRPDGFVAWQGSHPTDLAQHLARALGPVHEARLDTRPTDLRPAD